MLHRARQKAKDAISWALDPDAQLRLGLRLAPLVVVGGFAWAYAEGFTLFSALAIALILGAVWVIFTLFDGPVRYARRRWLRKGACPECGRPFDEPRK